ncbi:MFS general substrate transporter [Clavulina sp. PMI_390]|nr:MFS general substrate transporter [Clavulina sp. PMI_390]
MPTFLLFYCLFSWLVGMTGPLTPSMQESYGIGYTVVSIIFICKSAGAVTAALVNMYISDKFGYAKAATAGAVIQLIAFTIQAPRPPFPVLAVGYYIDGFGGALQDAQANTLLTMFPTNQHTKMMVGHGMYGLGALVSPLISTQFAQKKHWSFMYLTSLGLAGLAAAVLLAVFQLRSQASILEDFEARKNADQLGGDPKPVDAEEEVEYHGWDKYYALMRMPAVHLAALFIFTYVGAGVSLGSWSVTYLLRERGGGPSTGLQLSVWFTKSLVGNAIAISFVGFFLGPMYPQLVLVLAKLVPPSFIGGAVGWISCLGATGSAVFPFIAGAMASKFGVWVLQPLVVALMGAMMVFWALTLLMPAKRNSITRPGVADKHDGSPSSVHRGSIEKIEGQDEVLVTSAVLIYRSLRIQMFVQVPQDILAATSKSNTTRYRLLLLLELCEERFYTRINETAAQNKLGF